MIGFFSACLHHREQEKSPNITQDQGLKVDFCYFLEFCNECEVELFLVGY